MKEKSKRICNQYDKCLEELQSLIDITFRDKGSRFIQEMGEAGKEAEHALLKMAPVVRHLRSSRKS